MTEHAATYYGWSDAGMQLFRCNCSCGWRGDSQRGPGLAELTFANHLVELRGGE